MSLFDDDCNDDDDDVAIKNYQVTYQSTQCSNKCIKLLQSEDLPMNMVKMPFFFHLLLDSFL